MSICLYSLWIYRWPYLLGGSVGKESVCSADLGSILGLKRSPGEGNGNSVQYSCLENPMVRGVGLVTVHRVTRVRYHLATKPPSHTYIYSYMKYTSHCISEKNDLSEMILIKGFQLVNYHHHPPQGGVCPLRLGVVHALTWEGA